MLEVRGLRRAFGGVNAIDGVDLDVVRHGVVAIIGPNGAGKSTLFHLISARACVSQGDILLNGRSVVGLTPTQISRRGLSRSFQITNVFPRLTALDNIACSLLWSAGCGHSMWRLMSRLTKINARARQVIDDIGLADRARVPAGLLTYAEQRALEIGMSIAAGAEVILLDEPTAGMSRSETRAAVDLIRRVTQGRTLLMVEHDMHVVFDLADRISVLVRGALVACDSPAAIRANREVQEAYLGRGHA